MRLPTPVRNGWRACVLDCRPQHAPRLASLFHTTARRLVDASPTSARSSPENTQPHVPVLGDLFGRFHNYLRISVTERCNLRCQYCMPEEGIDLTENSQLLSSDEIIRVARIFVQQGVDKIRLTGGEPSIRKDIVDLVHGLDALRPLGLKQIAMTTNGIALRRKLPLLRQAGMNGLNISLDTRNPRKFELFTRRKG
ncbi:hypothetical protein LPJ62_006723, partial [Coemansia sp. RSA 2167]